MKKINLIKKSIFRLFLRIAAFVLFAMNSCVAQNALTFDNYINAVLDEPEVLIFDNKVDFLNQNTGQSPFLEELEIRTETDEWNLLQQEYLVRTSFNGKKERAREQAYYDSNKAVISAEKWTKIHGEITDRYSTWLTYFLVQEQQRLMERQLLISEDKLSILKTKASLTVDFDLNEYIKTEDQLHDIKRKQLMYQHEMQMMQAVIFQGIQDQRYNKIDSNQLLSIDRVELQVNNIPDSSFLHPEYAERLAQIDQLEKEYSLEKIQEKQILDFVQLKYAGRDKSDLYQEFSFGMGINIPLKNANQLKLNEILLEELEHKNKLTNDQYYNGQKIKQLKLYINLLIEQYRLLGEQTQNSQSFYSAQTYENLISSDPIMLLQIEESLLLRAQKKLDLKTEIYTLYIDLLDNCGLLSQQPFKNYLN